MPTAIINPTDAAVLFSQFFVIEKFGPTANSKDILASVAFLRPVNILIDGKKRPWSNPPIKGINSSKAEVPSSAVKSLVSNCQPNCVITGLLFSLFK